MSSCDSVSPTTFGAGAEHSEGVTYTTQKLQPTPGTGRPSQQLAGNRPKNRVTWVVWLCFQVAAGITFQLPRGRDVGPLSQLSGRARLCLLVAVALLAGSWCFWLVCPWCWLVGLCFVCFPFRGRRPKDRHFCRYFPLSSGTSVPYTRSPESAGQFFVNFVMGLMVGDRRFPGATILGVDRVLPTIRCQSLRQVQNILTLLCVVSVRDGRSCTSRRVRHVQYIVMGLSSCAS